MTLDERARQTRETIIKELWPGLPGSFIDGDLDSIEKTIAAQLREVEREAKDTQWKEDMKHCEASSKQVWNAAKEKAAGIADVNDGICDGGDHTTHKVAERIREMKP